MAVVRTDPVNDTRMYFFVFALGDVISPHDPKPLTAGASINI